MSICELCNRNRRTCFRLVLLVDWTYGTIMLCNTCADQHDKIEQENIKTSKEKN